MCKFEAHIFIVSPSLLYSAKLQSPTRFGWGASFVYIIVFQNNILSPDHAPFDFFLQCHLNAKGFFLDYILYESRPKSKGCLPISYYVGISPSIPCSHLFGQLFCLKSHSCILFLAFLFTMVM